MSQLVFEAPHYIHGLWLVAAIAGALWWLDRRLRRDTLEWIAPQLRARLIRSTTPGQRALRIVLLALAAAAMVIALMRPQWGYSTIITPRSGAQIMIALDVSRSMLAEDVVPNRLDRAKAEIRDLLSYLNGDQVGLIAFAGRATVLSPLTPDFRFVDLSLRDAIPGVTGRGGTRLEEPIRKASAGFGNAGHVSRSLILITDGEDHDSFPKAAAEQARDLGVRILAIGFGDEGGAPITITEPNTGARTQLRDDNGAVVQSRLDGDLLRELASITDGAYIPAGTGALDLESIYEAHIAPLTRGSVDGRERRIPNEVYQWPLLASMMFLFGALLSTYSARTARTSANRFGTLVLAFTLVSGPIGAPEAQNAASQSVPQASANENNVDRLSNSIPRDTTKTDDVDSKDTTDAEIDLPDSALESYNAGVQALASGAFDEAAKLFVHARTTAGDDRDVRYQATFNRAWVSIERAQKLRNDEDLQGALDALQVGAQWFSDAVKLRPKDTNARQNLELTLRRALQLEDQLDKQDDAIETRLDELADELHAIRSSIAELLETAQDPVASTTTKEAFRSAAPRALRALDDSQTLLRDVISAASAIDDSADANALARRSGLNNAGPYLHDANQRLAQLRARLRKAQGLSAFRRATHALTAVKNARNQLRPPLEQLDALVRDGREQVTLATSLVLSSEPPKWLTNEYLTDGVAAMGRRTGELRDTIKQAADAPPNAPPTAASSGVPAGPQAMPPPGPTPRQFAAALPHISKARSALGAAHSARVANRTSQASTLESSALESLGEAREQFLPLRQLIELAYTTQRQTQSATALGENSATRPNLEYAKNLHNKNLERMVRIGTALSEAMTARLPNADDAGQGQGNKAERERYEQAYQLWTTAQSAMHEVSNHLAEPLLDPMSKVLDNAVEASVNGIEALRRLFFTLVDHLKDTARQQAELNSDTETLAVLAEAEGVKQHQMRRGPLVTQQLSLAEFTTQLTEGLSQQAEASTSAQAAAPESDSSPGGASSAGPSPEALSKAAELVGASATLMREAGDALNREMPEFSELRPSQTEALEKLSDAIELLEPPKDDDQQDQQQQNQNQDNSGDSEERRNEQNAASQSMNQLLQGVRDREAQRRQKQARTQAGGLTVEKDW